MSSDDIYPVPTRVLSQLTGEIEELRGFIDDELQYLWGLLWDAYQHYLESLWLGDHPRRFDEGGTAWSGRCEGLAARIATATALVGPVSWRAVPMTALVGGWFEWANHKIGVANPSLPSDADLVRCREALRA